MGAFLILALATWRLSSLLARENGPWELLEKFRIAIGVRYDEQSEPFGTNMISRGIVCVWCSSVWFGTLFAAGALLSKQVTVIIAMPFALSTIAIIVEGYLDGTS